AADLFDHLVGEWEQLVGNIEAEFLKLARMDDVRRSRVLDHAAARNSARRRAPDRGGAGCLRLRRAGAADPETAAHRHEGEAGPSGYAMADFRQAALRREPGHPMTARTPRRAVPIAGLRAPRPWYGPTARQVAGSAEAARLPCGPVTKSPAA